MYAVHIPVNVHSRVNDVMYNTTIQQRKIFNKSTLRITRVRNCGINNQIPLTELQNQREVTSRLFLVFDSFDLHLVLDQLVHVRHDCRLLDVEKHERRRYVTAEETMAYNGERSLTELKIFSLVECVVSSSCGTGIDEKLLLVLKCFELMSLS